METKSFQNLPKFLEQFWTPLVHTINTFPKDYTYDMWAEKQLNLHWKLNSNIIRSLEWYSEMLKAYPWLLYTPLFTPNWWFGTLYKEWDQLHWWSIKESNMWEEVWFNALYIDLDIKLIQKYLDWNYTKIELLEDMHKHILDIWIPKPTFIVWSGWGFHWYRVLDKVTKINCSKKYNSNDLYLMEQELNSRFLWLWWDLAVGKWVTFRMRTPWYPHRKVDNFKKWWKEELDVVIYQRLDDDTITEDIDTSKLLYTNWDFIDTLFEEATRNAKANSYCIPWNAAHNKKVNKFFNWIKKSFTASDYASVEAINIKAIVQKLSESIDKYWLTDPEIWTYVPFMTDENSLWCKLANWTIITTHWWKIYEKQNRVKNFTNVWNGKLRPEWWPIEFMKSFLQNSYRIIEFVQEHFGISPTEKTDIQWSKITHIYKWNWSKLKFTENWVMLEVSTRTQDWNIVVIDTVIFKKTMKFLWYEDGMYLFELQNKDLIMMPRFATRTTMNNYLKDYRYMFYGRNDLDVWEFFDVLDWINEDMEKKIVLHSGIHEELWITTLGKNIIYKHNNVPTDDILFFMRWSSEKIEVAGNKQVDWMYAYQKLTECFDESYARCYFLQLIAIAWMNVWKSREIYPWMHLVWQTGSGKSLLIQIAESRMDYTPKQREVSIASNATTQQPLKRLASDYAMMFIEEVTNWISDWLQSIIRLTISRDTGMQWALNWVNVEFKMRAGILSCWERTYSDTSINNRLVILNIWQQKKRWSLEDVLELKDISITNRIYKKYFDNIEQIKSVDLYKQYVKMLIKEGYDERTADVWAYIFFINAVFEIGFDEKQLLRDMEYHTATIGLGKSIQMKSNPFSAFKGILHQAIMGNNINWSYYINDPDSYTEVEVYFQKKFFEENRAMIFPMTDICKWKLWVWLNNNLSFRYESIDWDNVDELLDWLYLRLKNYIDDKKFRFSTTPILWQEKN